jgi:hypothetical protein
MKTTINPLKLGYEFYSLKKTTLPNMVPYKECLLNFQ